MGDLHGRSGMLDALLEAVQPGPDDQLVFLGDYVDAGPDSSGVIDRLIALVAERGAIAILGNHDDMMRQAIRDPAHRPAWMDFGGSSTLASYPGASFESIPEPHVRFLERTCRLYFETPTHIFVHGGVEPDLPMNEQPRETLLWTKVQSAEAHASGRVVVCGHTRQRSGRPLDLGHTICIDTNARDGQWLTCLEVPSLLIWQVNASGRCRRGPLRG